jgi:malonyl-CoA/methylmalonyl-CoA synthetase
LRRSPDRVFLHLRDSDGEPATMTYAQVGALVDTREAELRSDGVHAGDRVMVVSENCPQHLALILACSRVGAWSCGVNARMAPGEIAGFSEKADARVHYFTTGVSKAAAAHAHRFASRASAVPGLERSAVRQGAIAETGTLGQRVAAIIFTSGTTGASKGVLMTHEGVTHFGRASAASRNLGEDDRSYAYLPMTHIFGLDTVLVASLVAGATLLMRASFEPADALDDLANHGLMQLQGPPTLFSRLLAHMEQIGLAHPPAPRLRYVYAGAGPLDMALKLRVEAAFGQPLHHGYGLSEYAGSVHLTRLGEWRKDTSAGYRVDGAALRIVDPHTGRELPTGERGEIWMRGVGLMPGYFRDPEATAAVIRAGGWYASGDLGELHADGALFVVGRLKEMIIRSGFNVYPAEVEAVLNAFPAIERSAVVGRPEQDGNEDVVAYVELRHGESSARPAIATCAGASRGGCARWNQGTSRFGGGHPGSVRIGHGGQRGRFHRKSGRDPGRKAPGQHEGRDAALAQPQRGAGRGDVVRAIAVGHQVHALGQDGEAIEHGAVQEGVQGPRNARARVGAGPAHVDQHDLFTPRQLVGEFVRVQPGRLGRGLVDQLAPQHQPGEVDGDCQQQPRHRGRAHVLQRPHHLRQLAVEHEAGRHAAAHPQHGAGAVQHGEAGGAHAQGAGQRRRQPGHAGDELGQQHGHGAAPGEGQLALADAAAGRDGDAAHQRQNAAPITAAGDKPDRIGQHAGQRAGDQDAQREHAIGSAA